MATDRDIGPNAMLFYYITAGNQDLTFRMDRMTGEMVTRPAPPDRERQQEYTLTVTVEDDGTPPLSVRAAWNVCNLQQTIEKCWGKNCPPEKDSGRTVCGIYIVFVEVCVTLLVKFSYMY